MLCPRCHAINRDNARFCKTCGMHFTAEQMAAQSEAQQPVAASLEHVHVLPQENGAVASQQVLPQENSAVASQQVPQAQAIDQDVQSQGDDAHADAPVDITHEPTQILSPSEMVAFHARLWQKEHALQEAGSGGAEVNNAPGGDVQNRASGSLEAVNGAPTAGNVEVEAEQVPAAEPIVASSSESTRIAPPPPPESLMPVIPGEDASSPVVNDAGYADAFDAASAPTIYAAVPVENGVSQSEQPVVDASQQETIYAALPSAPSPYDEDAPSEPAEPVAQGGSAALAVGTVLNGRYEVTQLVSESEHERVYQVVDHQGYQHCWNCGSEQNAEGDEYCIDCGAALLNMTYILHEYAATEAQNKEGLVTLGTIMNTFAEDGKTYVVEQPQTTQISFPLGVRLLVASDSDAGNVRRSEPNEDSTLVLQLQRVHESISTPVGVFMVADGMGGHDNGQGASRMTVNVVAERIVSELFMKPLTAERGGQPATALTDDALVDVFKGAIEEANNSICQVNQREKTDMGSTVTGFMIVNDHAYIINVGDSRTYMLRDGTLYQLTNDHSLVAQLLAGGLIEPDDVYTHPQRSQIFRSLGDKLNVQVDDFKQQVHSGDILLSCSDGLWEMIRNPQITDILSNAPDPQTACAQLLEAANTNGGEDNVSAVVVFVR